MHRRLAHLAAVVLVLLLAATIAGCADDDLVPSTRTTETAPAAGQPPGEDEGDAARRMERAIFDLVNDERRERDLEPFEWDDQLAMLGREWSRQMAERGRLEHQDPERMLERSEGFTAVGENIFAASGPVPASTIHVGWMRSDGHRANVLREEFDRLGVGVLCREGEVWVTQRFGRTSAAGTGSPSDEIPPEQPIVASRGEGPSCPGEGDDVRIDLEALT